MTKENKKSGLEKKLAAYSALAAGVFVVGSANAQIIYTDINPDSTIFAVDSFFLDLNNDGIVDFRINALKYQSSTTGSHSQFNIDVDYVAIEPLNNNEILSSYNYVSYYNYSSGAKALNKNDTIQDVETDENWWSESMGILNGQGSYSGTMNGSSFSGTIDYGHFVGVTNKYVGVRIEKVQDGDTIWQYGWVRLDVASNGKSFVVKDYAYQGAHDKYILAGMEVSGTIEKKIVENIEIYVSQKTLFIDFKELKKEDAIIRVLNINGQELLKKENSEKSEISLKEFTTGIYIVNIQFEEVSISKKVMLR